MRRASSPTRGQTTEGRGSYLWANRRSGLTAQHPSAKSMHSPCCHDSTSEGPNEQTRAQKSGGHGHGHGYGQAWDASEIPGGKHSRASRQGTFRMPPGRLHPGMSALTRASCSNKTRPNSRITERYRRKSPDVTRSRQRTICNPVQDQRVPPPFSPGTWGHCKPRSAMNTFLMLTTSMSPSCSNFMSCYRS